MKVVTYSRCSTSHHDQNPDIQVRQLRQFVRDRGWELSEEIVDHGYSGGTDRRPGLTRLLDLCRSKEVDAVVITKLDRLFRSLKMLVSTLDEFQSLGITFVSISDGLDYSSASGWPIAWIGATQSHGSIPPGRIDRNRVIAWNGTTYIGSESF